MDGQLIDVAVVTPGVLAEAMQSGLVADDAAAAFVHLHRQTQLVDARSRKQVVVFTLTPEPPHLCVLDFADNLLAASIQDGYQDAVTGANFRKELGEPVFTAIAADQNSE
jgi:hypothetical protein